MKIISLVDDMETGLINKISYNPIGGLCPNLPECTIAPPEINIDNKARFGYLDGYWLHLIHSSMRGTAAEADSHFSIFDESAFSRVNQR